MEWDLDRIGAWKIGMGYGRMHGKWIKMKSEVLKNITMGVRLKSER